MIILNASNLTLSFGTQTVLSGVSFSVNEGDRLGVIGVNGAGKTSLFRLITGEYTPDEGSVSVSRDKSIGLLEQNTAITGKLTELTLLEYMYDAFPELTQRERELADLERQMTSPDLTSERAAALAGRYDTLSRAFTADGGQEFRGRCRSMLLRMGFSEGELTLPVKALSGGQACPLAPALPRAGYPDAGRAHQPPGRGCAQLAGGIPLLLQKDSAGHIP